jgi:rod shape-determining protein MreC
VYDKTVRRRRAVLGLLVASSLILLTVYFGESAGGGLHSVQRGVVDVVSPIEEGASRALKPIRDLFGWAGDTLHAKGDVADLRKQRDALRRDAIRAQGAVRENEELKSQLGLNERLGLSTADTVVGRVTGYNPSLWYSQVQIDKGSSDGVRVDQPVMNGAGLVGRVSYSFGSTAIVTLITDHTTQVGGTVNESGVNGVVEVEAGRPNDLVLTGLSARDIVRRGQTVVTSGTLSRVGRLASPYPEGIPIGNVTRVESPGSDEQTVHIAPFADMRRLELLQVITRAGGEAAR